MWALLALTACHDPCDTPAVAVGTGVDRFEPLAEDADVDVINGPQGGWHVLGAVRTWGMGEVARVDWTLDRASDGARVGDLLYTVATTPTPRACSREFAGLFGVLSLDGVPHDEGDTPADAVDGERLVSTMTVTDDGDRAAVGTATIVAHAEAP